MVQLANVYWVGITDPFLAHWGHSRGSRTAILWASEVCTNICFKSTCIKYFIGSREQVATNIDIVWMRMQMRMIRYVDERECECEGVDCGLPLALWVPQARLPPSGANIGASRENIFELNLHNCSNWPDRNPSNPSRWSAPEFYLEFSLVVRREVSVQLTLLTSPRENIGWNLG